MFLSSVNKPCGTYYDKDRNKWQSYCGSYSGGRVRLGRFDTEKEALIASKTQKIHELLTVIDDMKDLRLRIRLKELCDRLYINFIKCNLS